MANQNDISVQVVLDDGSVKKTFSLLSSEAAKAGKQVSNAFDPGGTTLSNLFSAKNLGIAGAGGLVLGLNQSIELAGKLKSAFTGVVNSLLEISKTAENVRQVNVQFDFLSNKSVGVGNNLREAFEKASKGYTDTEELLGAVNKSLVDLGDQAFKLPQAFEIARKSTFIFGGTAVDNFERITQAVVTGSSRAVRSIGLYVDLDKAVKKYADSIGVLPERLTDSEREQARLNAILEKGKSAFDGVTNVKQITSSFKLFSVQMKEAGEAIDVALNKIFGPALKSMAETGTSFLKRFTTDLNAAFGSDENAKRTSQIEKLEAQISSLQKTIAKPTMNDVFNLDDYKKELAGAEATLRTLKNTQAAIADDERKAAARRGDVPENVRTKGAELDSKANPLSRFTADEIAKNNAQINEAISRGEDEALQIRIQAANNIQDLKLRNAELDNLDAERQVQAEVNLESRIAKIKEEFSIKKGFDQKLTNQLIEIETENSAARIEEIESESAKRRNAQASAMAAQLKSIMVSGISSTFQQVGANLQAGKGLFDDFGKGIVGIVGDMIIKIGEGLIAQGIAMEAFITSINTLLPGAGLAAAAAGVGLVIFGGALKASVGAGGGGGASPAIESGGGGGGIATEPGSPTTVVTDTKPKEPGVKVDLIVQGNILDRRQTGLELAEVLQDTFSQQGVQIQGAFA